MNERAKSIPGSVIVAVLLTMPLTACSTKPAARISTAANASVMPDTVYPAGIKAPINTAIGQKMGIYAGDTATGCCFLSDHAALQLEPPARARFAVFNFYVPDHKPFDKMPERVVVSINAGAAHSYSITPGTQSVSVPLPSAERSKEKTIAKLRMTPSYVPKALGINDDIRLLSIMLTKVTYR